MLASLLLLWKGLNILININIKHYSKTKKKIFYFNSLKFSKATFKLNHKQKVLKGAKTLAPSKITGPCTTFFPQADV